MASDGFSHEITIPVQRDRVWAELQDADTWRSLAGVHDIFEVEHDEHGNLAGYRWTAAAGPRHIEGSALVVRRHRPDLMVLKVDAGEVTGSIDARLREAGEDSTTLHVEVQLEAHGILASLFFGLVSDVIARGLPDQLEEFGARLVEEA